MQLIFFDLDGTLLNNASQISPFTQQTLALLAEKDIAYTVATGRTMLSAQRILQNQVFELPQIYNNGVTVWDPNLQTLTLENLLSPTEVANIISVAKFYGVTPFVNSVEGHQHFIFHSEIKSAIEQELVEDYFSVSSAKLLPLEALPSQAQVTNISMIGSNQTIQNMWRELNLNQALIAYSGKAIQGDNMRWMDVHHSHANKGTAVTQLKNQLGATKVMCFGDGDNDLSMFALADESYAPQNATDEVKRSASAVIGDNHNDGIAHFLRERFSL
ncbi:HAD family hydrolase [Paraglaciecola aestuariivivens]